MIKDGKFVWKIIKIGHEETVGKNNLRKKTFVLQEVSDKEYKGSIAIDLIKDNVSKLDGFKEGDYIETMLNFRANEYNSKWYNGVNAWSIKKMDMWVTQAQVDESFWSDLPF